uniref:Transcription factor MYC/MYB N-terminal domain-containing protein n=1 Tax=Ananas comosus var. bracteatus TaxID=296719 RepID=A0A6V7PAU7_ANACO|nr:unnamed protein product [Ananas comosus var. bracteatus]
MVGSGAIGGGGGGGDSHSISNSSSNNSNNNNSNSNTSRSKEAAGMMALHDALRNVCLNSDWTYSVFWTIRPRPRCRGGNGCKVGDDNGSLMLMWEDGFCRAPVAECLEEIDGEDQIRKAFSKMSIQLYNYGEGLMGKVASDKCHKWVFKEPSECEPNIPNYWQSSFDATIAVIQAGHGLLQLGSCKIIPEDLHFVLRMRHMFESLGYQSGFFLSQLFSSGRGPGPAPPPNAAAALKQAPTRPPAPAFNWHPHHHHPMQLPPAAVAQMQQQQPPFHHHHHHHPNSSRFAQMDDGMISDSELRWPNGLSFFTALTGRADDAKLLFGGAGHGQFSEDAKAPDGRGDAEHSGDPHHHQDYLSLESNSSKVRKMESSSSKFKRSLTMPARMDMNENNSASSTPSLSLDHHHHQHQHQHQHHHHAGASSQGMEYRSSETGIYSDIMETFLE